GRAGDRRPCAPRRSRRARRRAPRTDSSLARYLLIRLLAERLRLLPPFALPRFPLDIPRRVLGARRRRGLRHCLRRAPLRLLALRLLALDLLGLLCGFRRLPALQVGVVLGR